VPTTVIVLSAAAALAAGALGTTAVASTPGSSTITVPQSINKSASVKWTGSIPPASDGASDCSTIPANATSDPHAIKLVVPGGTGLYKKLAVTMTFLIKWTPANPTGKEDASDEILTVLDPQGNEIASSDGGSPTESLTVDDPKPGTYTALACGFVNSVPQPYTGIASLTTAPHALPSGPLSSTGGLAFSASVPSDPQRNEAEPAVVTDRDGLIYTCGPNGFSNVADYAQVSTDGGDQFHLLGTSPRGQVSTPPQGGGDCALATAPLKPKGAKNYPVAYAGLGPLTGFSTAVSTDGGRTLKGSPDSESFPGTDRQWIGFSDATHAFFVYNSTGVPGGQTVQTSTDGGFTYGAVGQAVATDGSRVGQIHTILRDRRGHVVADPRKAVASKAIVYFPYTTATGVKIAMSQNGGSSWSQCLAVLTKVDPNAGFPSADNDEAGNIYVTYAEKGGGRDTYLVALPARDITKCKGASSDSAANNVDPGFGPKIRINRGGVETTVMPWVAAGGKGGRVAVAYYGTKSVGDPNVSTFKATWNVYVDQILDAFKRSGAPNPTPHVAQVSATTHPFHYDSICLDGLACDTTENGDRSLADYFTIDYDKKNGRLFLVYDQSYKTPGESTGPWATPAVVYQVAGPSNGGGKVHVPGREALRTSSPDPSGDAIANYSRLDLVGAAPTSPAAATKEPALDLVGSPAVRVERELDPKTGRPVRNGGFTVTMQVKNLSSASLQQALQDTGSSDAMFLFRFVNGFQEAGASAHWDPVQGWRFGFDQFTTTTQNPGGDVLIWPGKTPIQGSIQGNVITLSVPRSVLYGLSGGTGNGQRPHQVAAQPGTRLYDATAFTMVGPAPSSQGVGGSYMQQVDNAPAFDFLLPGGHGGEAGRSATTLSGAGATGSSAGNAGATGSSSSATGKATGSASKTATSTKPAAYSRRTATYGALFLILLAFAALASRRWWWKGRGEA
jgi:hypothetical protein